jgi:hypothetical protein
MRTVPPDSKLFIRATPFLVSQASTKYASAPPPSNSRPSDKSILDERPISNGDPAEGYAPRHTSTRKTSK